MDGDDPVREVRMEGMVADVDAFATFCWGCIFCDLFRSGVVNIQGGGYDWGSE